MSDNTKAYSSYGPGELKYLYLYTAPADKIIHIIRQENQATTTAVIHDWTHWTLDTLAREHIGMLPSQNFGSSRVTHYVLQSGFSAALTTTLSTPVFRRNPPQHFTILSNQLSMTPDHIDWGMSKMTPSKNAQASSAF